MYMVNVKNRVIPKETIFFCKINAENECIHNHTSYEFQTVKNLPALLSLKLKVAGIASPLRFPCVLMWRHILCEFFTTLVLYGQNCIDIMMSLRTRWKKKSICIHALGFCIEEKKKKRRKSKYWEYEAHAQWLRDTI